MHRMHRTLALAIMLLLSLLLAQPGSAAMMTYTATLSGAEEVPANASTATGTATYSLSDDGKTLNYAITVTNLNNPVMAHIHLGKKGENGPIIVPLFAGQAASGPKTGTLVQGSVSVDKLAGPMAGKSLTDLIAAIEAGNTYTNVHTNDGKDPANSGPGDLAAGEIRGQNIMVMPSGQPIPNSPGLPNTGGGYVNAGHPTASGLINPILLGGLLLAAVLLSSTFFLAGRHSRRPRA